MSTNATEESNSTVQVSIAYVKRLIKLAYQTRRAIFLHGRPGSGKCLDKDTLVFDATTGGLVRIGDFDVNHDVASFVNGEIIRVTPESKIDQGVQTVYEIETRTGRRITATGNHPFLALDSTPKYHFATNFFWKELRQLKIGDRIALASNCPIFGNDELDEKLVKFVAYLIAEGHYKPSRVTFTNADPEILEEFTNLCKELRLPFRSYPKKDSPAVVITISSGMRGKQTTRPPNPAYQTLKNLQVKIANSG